MGRVEDARMSWLAPSGVLGWLGNRHHPGRAGARLLRDHQAREPRWLTQSTGGRSSVTLAALASPADEQVHANGPGCIARELLEDFDHARSVTVGNAEFPS